MSLSLLLLFLLLSLPFALALNQDGLYLLQAKRGLSDPAGALSSWNARDPDPCSWAGVSCGGGGPDRRVTALDLTNSQLAGPFPLFLCRLPYLSSLSLGGNNINSTLPPGVSACCNLTRLDLSQNLLQGDIPGSLAAIPGLAELDLSFNSFSGGLPPAFGEFARLESLLLVSNILNGTMPSFLGNVTSLKTLELAYNPWTPSEFPSQFSNLTNLEVLWLSDCRLTGPIPESFGGLSRLVNLDLSRNRLTGPIPGSLAWLKSAVQIELFNNSLSGELSLQFSNLTNLRRLDVSTNELTGAIPGELCDLPLGSLNLFENRFEGTIPESIALSENLYELMLFNNKLTGSLPSDLGKNSPSRSLDVSYIQFSGQIPENLCAHGKLEELVLLYNNFFETIPASLGKCESLHRIRLTHNQLSGTVPEGLWGLPHVYLLDLAENSLVGNVSDALSGAHNLSVLDISRNLFSGSVPDGFAPLTRLVEFSGSHNNFSGRIPGSLVQLSQLSKLDLSYNGLSGEIPEGIKAWKMLNELNLANNKLSGEIPGDVGSLTVLNYLDLSGNYFSGKIPDELQNLKLNLLNLSNNQLSGDIPPMYAKQVYENSFVGNPGLCGDLPGLCPRRSDGRKSKSLWMLSVIFVLAVLVLVVGISWFYCKYKNFKKTRKGATMSKWRSFHKLGFSELEIADCLQEDKVIGSGGSGKVYKVELSNGEVVAVKKLRGVSKKEALTFESEKDGYQVEVETLGKIRHKNIVRLWCCCNTEDCKLLVYEYMPNGSLGDMLHGSKGSLLDWRTRYKIALDAAEGLSYLHHDCVPPIVHRDVKSNNILLDAEFGAKVADFGVAKIVGVGNGEELMSVIAGSYGYIAPEYAYTLRVNEKSDIYSFGVVILELVTGRLPVDPAFGEKDLVKWVGATLNQKGIDDVIDPKLDASHKEEITKVLDVGLLCTHSLPISRPSMRKVVKLLQEAGSGSKVRIAKRDGELSPYYYEDASNKLNYEPEDPVRSMKVQWNK
ncbi:receptor-like protein kinase HSL1 [Syzygium oleosum]|uniref:receptor-like protein kinase HSL1 n=1 Tax=Syzygium oleosum TaxID=219896 RepID=UPI0024BA0777|nr:receptor-like protein kinase HSL1 [Syzygium oleosum]